MGSERIRVGILCGGESPEHEVSLLSAKNIVAALNPSKYEVTIIGISREGEWGLRHLHHWLINEDNPEKIALAPASAGLAVQPKGRVGAKNAIVTTESGITLPLIDVVFPVLHGPNGEDGTIQGLLRLAHIPFIGPDVLGSSIGMDKDVMKRLLRDAKVPIAPFVSISRQKSSLVSFKAVTKELGPVLFIKPANMGSSVGVSRADSEESFIAATEEAFRFDDKILIEQEIIGQEIECSVIGNEVKRASLPGKVIPSHTFYSYEAKYLDPDGASFEIPAILSEGEVKNIQDTAIRTCEVLCIDGMSRVDMFLKKDGEVLVNEVNTIPGFTRISMYPKMWEASGLEYGELLDELITLAISRNKKQESRRIVRN
jgi:D-alanine-D-alanine ligase